MPDPQVDITGWKDDFQNARYYLFISNALAVFVLTIANAPGINIPFLRAGIKLVIPFFSTFVYIMCTTCLMEVHKPDNWKALTNNGSRVVIYFIIQSNAYDAYLLATFTFLALRFFMRHKPFPEHWGSGTMLETEESLTAWKELNFMFINAMVPFYISYVISTESFGGGTNPAIAA